MMRQMRENTKWIMLITALAFVALMVFEWGMDLTGRSGAQMSGGEMGRVNGEPIAYEEFLAVYRNLYQQQQSASEAPLTPAMNREIEEAAWEQLVSQKLIDQEMQRRGIRVTDAEVLEAARNAPPQELMTAPAFQNEQGEFDINLYRQYLASPTLDEGFLQQLEAYYRDVIPRSKLYFQNTAGVFVSDGQLWRMYRDANETATVEYAVFSPETMVRDDQVTVSDAEVRAFYTEHRESFLRPGQATVRYVSLVKVPTAEDSVVARQEAERYRAEAAAEPFETVARRAGATEVLTRMHGESFSVARGQSAPALEAAVFATPIGAVSEPILTDAGLHLIKVESRSGDTAQVRQIVVPIELSRINEDRLLDRVDSLEAAAEDVGLEQAAARLGLEVRTADISEALPVLPGVGSVDDGLDWAMEEGTAGEVSGVFENETTYYLLELVTKQEEGTLTLEEATPTIRPALLRKAKVVRARELLANVERRARAGEPLQLLAGLVSGGRVQTAGPFTRGDFVPGMGRINAAVGAPFGLRVGQTSPLVEAEQMLYLVRVTGRTEPSRAEWQAQLPQQRQRVVQAMGDTRWQQYLTALRENAEIVDNRRELRRQQDAAAAAAPALPLR